MDIDKILKINVVGDGTRKCWIEEKMDEEGIFPSYTLYATPHTSYSEIEQTIKNFWNSEKGKEVEEQDYLTAPRSEEMEFIKLIGTAENVSTFLKENEGLPGKKVIVNPNEEEIIYAFDKQEIEEVERHFKEYPDSYIMVDEHVYPVQISECKKAIQIIDDIVARVSALNFSPIEQLMYVYDIVKDRCYIKEGKEEEFYTSRDLTAVILGNKIVCLGYSQIFQAIITKLGFKNMVEHIRSSDENNDIGHARNNVYVKDDKYHIEGIYSFDTTWDSKIDENDTTFVDHYSCFAKTRNQTNPSRKKQHLETIIPYQGMIDKLDSLVDDNGRWKTNNVELPLRYFKQINTAARFVDDTQLIINPFSIKNKGKVKRALQRYEALYNNPIDANTFLRILYAVRKQQHYENPPKYPLDKKSLLRCLLRSNTAMKSKDATPTVESSQDEVLTEMMVNEVTLLDNPIFGRLLKRRAQQKIVDFMEEEDFDKKVEGIKTTKVLRKIYEKRINQ